MSQAQQASMQPASHNPGGQKASCLISVEPKAAQTAEHSGLNERYPASMKLHDDCEGAVRCQDDVVNHGGVVADPHIVGPVDWPWTMIPNNTCPGGHKHAALELYKRPFPRVASSPILKGDARLSLR